MKETTIKFDDIQKANETIKTTDIKGKDYAEVNQRIKAFRMVYPDGVIKTEMKSNKDGICIFEANVYEYYIEEPSSFMSRGIKSKLLATGTAYEKENSTFINKTSYIENCETSAVGRALGMCGFGIDTSVASAEEVQNAIANQEEEIQKASPKQIKILNKMTDANKTKVYKKYGVSNLEELNINQASEIISLLTKGKK